MVNISIIPTEFHHLGELSRSLRGDDIDEILGGGGTPFKSIKNCYKRALYSKTALVDGKVGAIWGVAGSLLSGVGAPYFLTSVEADKVHPVRFARIYGEEVNNMLVFFPKLENWCAYSYKKSLRLLQLCGFTIGDPQPVGKNGALFCKFTLEGSNG